MNDNFGITLIIILTIVFIFTFMYGKRTNLRRGNAIWKKLSKVIKEIFGVKKVGYRGLGSSAYQLLLLKPSKDIKKYEITVVLLDRENILHYIIQKYKGTKDSIIIKEDFYKKIDFRINIYNVNKKNIKKGSEVNGLDGIKFYGDKNSKDFLNKIKGDLRIFKDIFSSISISKESPNLVMIFDYDEDNLYNIIRFSKEISRYF